MDCVTKEGREEEGKGGYEGGDKEVVKEVKKVEFLPLPHCPPFTVTPVSLKRES